MAKISSLQATHTENKHQNKIALLSRIKPSYKTNTTIVISLKWKLLKT